MLIALLIVTVALPRHCHDKRGDFLYFVEPSALAALSCRTRHTLKA